MKPETSRGQWWLPGTRHRVGGTLRFDPNDRGLVLELLGSFEEASVEERLDRILGGSPPKEYELIHGSCVEEDEVTLLQAQELGSSGKGPGTFEYLIRAAFMGGRFRNPDSIEFTKASLRLTHLTSLIPTPKIKPTHKSSKSGELEKLNVDITMVPDLVVPLPDLTLTFRRALDESYGWDKGVGFAFPAVVDVELKRPTRFVDLLESVVTPVQNLLTLLFDQPNALDELTVFSPHIKQGRFKNDRSLTPVRVLYHAIYASPDTKRTMRPLQLLELGPPDEVLGRWFRISHPDDLGTVISQLLSVRYAPFLFLENRFLNVIQALENFHRRRYPDENEPAAKFAERKNRILSLEMQNKDMTWLQGKFKRLNDRPLSKRISDVSKSCDAISSELIGDRHAFSTKAEATRNFLSHRVTDLQAKAASGPELHWLMTTVSYVLTAALLQETGVQVIPQLMTTNPRFNFATVANSEFEWGPKRPS